MNASLIKRDPVTFLEAAIKKYIATSPNNIMPDFLGERMWDEPLVGFANGDDPRPAGSARNATSGFSDIS